MMSIAIFTLTSELHDKEAVNAATQQFLDSLDINFEMAGADLTTYGNHALDLTPVHKAVYLLFLNHPEGIEFKKLSDHRDELLHYYMETSRMMDKEKIIESVNHLTDPLDNAINEKCSRIKKVFLSLMDEYSASYYFISGHTQRHVAGSDRIWYERLKVITLPRQLVVREDF